jgi:hypothetical protein
MVWEEEEIMCSVKAEVFAGWNAKALTVEPKVRGIKAIP